MSAECILLHNIPGQSFQGLGCRPLWGSTQPAQCARGTGLGNLGKQAAVQKQQKRELCDIRKLSPNSVSF